MPHIFLHELDAFVNSATQAHTDDQQMLRRLQQLADELAPTFQLEGYQSDNALAGEARQLMIALASQLRHWHDEWQQRQPMRQMSESFADRLVLLVFGKVNAGKSSLINHLALSLAAKMQVTPQFFQLQQGQPITIPGPLEEGATETTSHIQGVTLGQHLVIIDTPGLHSVTAENAMLTRRYTDAADAVIWLTPSTNPGLVHELDALGEELRLGKPVLPVISRSDTVEETLDPQTDELQSRWVPKDPARRQSQQQDVYARACQHLGSQQHLLWQPVSISVHCAQRDPASDHGLPALYHCLGKLTQQATRQKGQKWRIQQEGFWLREVQPQLRQLPPRLLKLASQMEQQRQQLQEIRQRCQLAITARLSEGWPALVTRHSGDEQALLASYRAEFRQVVEKVLEPELAPFFAALPEAGSLLDSDAFGRYEQALIEYQVPVGQARQRRGQLFGSLIGGGLGLLGGPLAGLAGAAIGGWVGGKFSDDIAYRTETLEVGIDSTAVLHRGMAAIEQDVATALARMVTELTARYLDPVASYCRHAQMTLAPLCAETTQTGTHAGTHTDSQSPREALA